MQIRQTTQWVACAAIVGGMAACVAAADGNSQSSDLKASDIEFFENQVRPILVERCQACHSSASTKASGGLTLDTREGWLKGGDSGPAVIPGKPAESLLIRAVQYHDDGPQMPPEEKGGPLPQAQVAALVEWVARGAPDPRLATSRIAGMAADEARHWWSFQELRAVEPPRVGNTNWPRGELDSFILAEIEKHQLSPAPPADKRTLLRRATFDLTGLPPTPAEVEAFINDPASDAFERVVDRLLGSSAYGQRWARHWLDVVRYADFYDANPATRTASCELTEAWRYRDWVVEAFNADLPFDQFIVHQIAGDLLPDPAGSEVYPAGLVATTFLSNGVWDRGDADKEKIVSDMVDDNIDVIGKAFLGLTLGCARCHDHKFDPITTADYYALAGIFYSTHILKDLGAKGAEYVMNRVPLVPAATVQQRAEQEKQLAAASGALNEFDARQRYLNLVADRIALVPESFQSAAGATGAIAADGTVMVTGALGKDSYILTARVPENAELKYICIEALADAGLPAQGPGRAADGNFVVTDFDVSFSSAAGSEPGQPVKLIAAHSDFEQKDFSAALVIDDKPQGGWGIKPAVGKDHAAVFEVAPGTVVPPGARCRFTIEQKHSDSETLGKFRLSVLSHARPESPPDVPQRQELVARRDQLQKEMLPPIPLAMAVQEGGTPGGLFPGIQDVPIHIRGNYARLGEVVPRRLPLILAGNTQSAISQGSGRRELAAWVASKDNPLTPRVIVNRVWQWHFGSGLVRTPSNFGKLGQAPTHPELLDYLAAKFVDEGWSLKNLHRRIMLSATYQQSSKISHELIEADPENLWLARFTPRRLEAEAIRDAMLFVSGQLDPTPGGPAGDDLTIRRRSLYVQTARWDRSGFATLFDAANPDSSTDQRMVSTVAPQALLLLNHDFVLAQARQLAERLAREAPPDPIARLQYAYQLLFGRPARPPEIEIAQKLITASDAQRRDRAWVDLAHLLLCANEFVYLD